MNSILQAVRVKPKHCISVTKDDGVKRGLDL